MRQVDELGDERMDIDGAARVHSMGRLHITI